MPCSYDGPTEYEIMRPELDNVTRWLCAFMKYSKDEVDRNLKGIVVSLDLDADDKGDLIMWYNHHVEIDRKREREKIKQEKERLKQEGLRKLTQDEMRALGLIQ